MIEVLREDLDYALAESPWKISNDVLYTLCQKYPSHVNDGEIIAKIWLIGRSYAAAIERRKNAEETSDSFYEKRVVQFVKESKLDEWINDLPAKGVVVETALAKTVAVHQRLTCLFKKISGFENVSLASKYLHFHRPDLFFILDRRADDAVGELVPDLKETPRINAVEFNPRYRNFCRRCQSLTEKIEQKFDVKLTPRQIDNLLLSIYCKLS